MPQLTKTKPVLAKRLAHNVQIITADSPALVGRWNKSMVLSVDAEWRNELRAQVVSGKLKDTYHARFLTSQFGWNEHGKLHVLVIWHPDYALPKTVDIPELDTLYILLADPEVTSPYTLGMCGPKSSIHALMFFALHDVRSLVGNDVFTPWILPDSVAKTFDSFKGFTGNISKKRKHTGTLDSQTYGKLTIVDVSGTTTAGMTLDAFHESVGCESPYKKLSSSWDKSHMETWITAAPDTFLPYAVGDVLFLETAMLKRVQQVNDMVQDALGFSPNYIAPWARADKNKGETRFPMSAGSLVSTTFEKWLEQDETYNRMLTALVPFTEYHTKQGQQLFNKTYLEPMMTGEPGLWKGQTLTHYDPAHPLTSLPNRDGWQSEEVLESYHPLSSASIPAQAFYHSGRNSTGVLNAIVYGGRCVNERPNLHRIENVLDIDLNSCYGSALADFTLPVGFPRVLKYASSDLKRVTLGAFIKSHGSELVDNCYQIYVSGKLPFRQDLVASKIGVDEKSILKKLLTGWEDGKDYDNGYSNDSLGRDVDKAHIPGDMVHLLSECVHSVITSDILNAINNISSNTEKRGWMNLEVETVTYYAKSDRVDNIEDFERICSEYTPMKFVNTVPVTPPVWFPVPMAGFVGKFVSARKRIKKQSVVKNDTAFLLQNGIKLFINTTYGCMASPFFRMGSTVLANNITAKARLGAWMMAKSLGSVQSITDGGMYSHDSVRLLDPARWQGKKPSFATLASYEDTNRHRSVSVGPLYLSSFQLLKEQLHNGQGVDEFECDVLAHINRFWGHYGMTLPFKIEHKYENTCDMASYDGSANYLMVGTKSKNTRTWGTVAYPYTFKCRGAKDYDGKPHAKESLLWAYTEIIGLGVPLNNPDGQLQQALSKVKKLVQLTAYQKMYVEYQGAGLLPGDSVDEVQILRPNENFRLMDTEEEYRQREKSYNDYSKKFDKQLESLGPLGRQFGLDKHDAPSKRGPLGRNFPDFYGTHYE